jgi:dolichol-phosphate mannosyltransferase
MLFSIVIPIYNEESLIDELCTRLKNTFEKLELDINVEVIFVNDGSSDMSLEKLKLKREEFPDFKILSLSRNFGHQIAITAGCHHAKGDFVAVIDADLQDPPECLIEMLNKACEGYDVVYGQRISREGESPFKLWTASIFYRFLKYITKVDLPLDSGDFRIMSKRVVDVLKKMPERHLFVRGMVAWVGFKQIAFPYKRDARFAGETKYSLSKMIRLAMDAITSFSMAPLKITVYLGFISVLLGVLYTVFIFCCYLFGLADLVKGWSSLMVALIVFAGIQLIVLGVVGQYIGRIFEQVQARPLYLVDKFHHE